MKKQTEKSPINIRTIENDLKTLFRSGDHLDLAAGQDEPEPTINLEQAVQLFDQLRAARSASTRPSLETKWSHPSVLALNEPDPVSAIISRARNLVLRAMEAGWSGPPYNPFALAEMLGMKLLPTEKILDARTYSNSQEQFTIEFNPQRPAARMRYSIAHELGHTLFRDCAAITRNRATHEEMKDDDWQLEFLCNMAAAEILMPFGTLQEELSIRPSTGRVLDLRRKYLVSCEAIVNRLIRLSAFPCVAFFARLDKLKSRYFVEYRIPSPALQEELAIHRGYILPHTSKAPECVAIGTRQREDARWISSGKPWFVEYLGISPNTGEAFPRVLGLAFPPLSDNSSFADPLRVVKGDASEPVGAEPKLLLQVVNDQAQIWGGGFAKQIRQKWPQAQAHFRQWACGPQNLKLGNIHSFSVRQDLTLVSLISQKGFGKPASGPRLRYGALFSTLEKVAELAIKKRGTVHMPRIGTGEAGGSWSVIEGIIRETLISRGIKVTIYDLAPRSHDFPRQPSFEFPKEIVDEVF
jgi:Zn-dependent peptidase ImmA (M78 family)/O-acetyl-ADP-ribose deacetylase (regulator of RNase III)